MTRMLVLLGYLLTRIPSCPGPNPGSQPQGATRRTAEDGRQEGSQVPDSEQERDAYRRRMSLVNREGRPPAREREGLYGRLLTSGTDDIITTMWLSLQSLCSGLMTS